LRDYLFYFDARTLKTRIGREHCEFDNTNEAIVQEMTEILSPRRITSKSLNKKRIAQFQSLVEFAGQENAISGRFSC
jgi:hypothetical protein